MANQIPMLEGTGAAGGFLVPDGYGGLAFERGINRLSAVRSMPGLKVIQVDAKTEKIVEYVGRPTVGTVGEGGDKPVTGAEFAEVTVNVVKAGGIVMFSDELLADAKSDPTPAIARDVGAAFDDYIDSNALGRNGAGAVVGTFNSELTETTSAVEYTGTPTAVADKLATAVSEAMSVIEGNGYEPTGVILAHDARRALRDARQASEATAPVYSAPDGGYVQPVPALYGLPIGFTTNLDTVLTAGAAGRVIGLVGDFSQAVLAVRHELRTAVSDQATILEGATQHRLWQQNKVAIRWEGRVGFVAHDLNRSFVKITNATA